MPTVEEVALALDHLADLKGPDVTHPWMGGVKHEGLHGAAGCPRSEDELTGITFHALLQTQAAHLECGRVKRRQEIKLSFKRMRSFFASTRPSKYICLAFRFITLMLFL